MNNEMTVNQDTIETKSIAEAGLVERHVRVLCLRKLCTADSLNCYFEGWVFNSDSETWQCLACGAFGTIGRNCADNLNPISLSEVHNGTATNSIDCNAVNKVGVPETLVCANIAGKEAERLRSDGRKTEPANFSPNVDELTHWKKCYWQLWELKIAFEKENESNEKRDYRRRDAVLGRLPRDIADAA